MTGDRPGAQSVDAAACRDRIAAAGRDAQPVHAVPELADAHPVDVDPGEDRPDNVRDAKPVHAPSGPPPVWRLSPRAARVLADVRAAQRTGAARLALAHLPPVPAAWWAPAGTPAPAALPPAAPWRPLDASAAPALAELRREAVPAVDLVADATPAELEGARIAGETLRRRPDRRGCPVCPFTAGCTGDACAARALVDRLPAWDRPAGPTRDAHPLPVDLDDVARFTVPRGRFAAGLDPAVIGRTWSDPLSGPRTSAGPLPGPLTPGTPWQAAMAVDRARAEPRTPFARGAFRPVTPGRLAHLFDVPPAVLGIPEHGPDPDTAAGADRAAELADLADRVREAGTWDRNTYAVRREMAAHLDVGPALSSFADGLPSTWSTPAGPCPVRPWADLCAHTCPTRPDCHRIAAALDDRPEEPTGAPCLTGCHPRALDGIGRHWPTCPNGPTLSAEHADDVPPETVARAREHLAQRAQEAQERPQDADPWPDAPGGTSVYVWPNTWPRVVTHPAVPPGTAYLVPDTLARLLADPGEAAVPADRDGTAGDPASAQVTPPNGPDAKPMDASTCPVRPCGEAPPIGTPCQAPRCDACDPRGTDPYADAQAVHAPTGTDVGPDPTPRPVGRVTIRGAAAVLGLTYRPPSDTQRARDVAARARDEAAAWQACPEHGPHCPGAGCCCDDLHPEAPPVDHDDDPDNCAPCGTQDAQEPPQEAPQDGHAEHCARRPWMDAWHPRDGDDAHLSTRGPWCTCGKAGDDVRRAQETPGSTVQALQQRLIDLGAVPTDVDPTRTGWTDPRTAQARDRWQAAQEAAQDDERAPCPLDPHAGPCRCGPGSVRCRPRDVDQDDQEAGPPAHVPDCRSAHYPGTACRTARPRDTWGSLAEHVRGELARAVLDDVDRQILGDPGKAPEPVRGLFAQGGPVRVDLDAARRDLDDAHAVQRMTLGADLGVDGPPTVVTGRRITLGDGVRLFVAPLGTEAPHEAPEPCPQAPYADPGPDDAALGNPWRDVGHLVHGATFEPAGDPDPAPWDGPDLTRRTVTATFTMAAPLDRALLRLLFGARPSDLRAARTRARSRAVMRALRRGAARARRR